MNAKHHLVPTRVEKTADILEPLAISPEVLYDLNELPLRGLRNALISVARQDGANFSPEILADGIEEIKSRLVGVPMEFAFIRADTEKLTFFLRIYMHPFKCELLFNAYPGKVGLMSPSHFRPTWTSSWSPMDSDVLTVMARLKLKRVPGPRQYVVGDEGSPPLRRSLRRCKTPMKLGISLGTALVVCILCAYFAAPHLGLALSVTTGCIGGMVVLSLLMHVLFNQPSAAIPWRAHPRILRDFSLFLHHRPRGPGPQHPFARAAVAIRDRRHAAADMDLIARAAPRLHAPPKAPPASPPPGYIEEERASSSPAARLESLLSPPLPRRPPPPPLPISVSVDLSLSSHSTPADVVPPPPPPPLPPAVIVPIPLCCTIQSAVPRGTGAMPSERSPPSTSSTEWIGD
ncbi:hypothetical protein PAPYR_2951 [Paratrimastix pyriformis]|uniref:Uncharacterized protein n=1 Tax=Paratrimastix pyriformis TaxID=342808 RepID=A0ABQ8UNH0_9EUKA|nr:hypothetical protein PAPYR_2951 [Paratrimastix pyriformis]